MAGVSVMIFLDANAFYSYIGRRNLGLIESRFGGEYHSGEDIGKMVNLNGNYVPN